MIIGYFMKNRKEISKKLNMPVYVGEKHTIDLAIVLIVKKRYAFI